MELLGYIGMLVMGLVLGLIGGGGSILTVPILVYLFSVDKVTATGYSLFIVGVTALMGAGSHVRAGNIHWRTVITFGAPSILAVFATRMWLMPALPLSFGEAFGVEWSKGTLLLLLFAVLMVAAAWGMIRKSTSSTPRSAQSAVMARLLSMVEGLMVGVLTGLVGAGGGFLIVPALVLLAGLGMKQAIGTSLVIIGAKSLIGFGGDLLSGLQADWGFLLGSIAAAGVGILIGASLAQRVPGEKLKPAFGWFVLVMGVVIIVSELRAG